MFSARLDEQDLHCASCPVRRTAVCRHADVQTVERVRSVRRVQANAAYVADDAHPQRIYVLRDGFVELGFEQGKARGIVDYVQPGESYMANADPSVKSLSLALEPSVICLLDPSARPDTGQTQELRRLGARAMQEMMQRLHQRAALLGFTKIADRMRALRDRLPEQRLARLRTKDLARYLGIEPETLCRLKAKQERTDTAERSLASE